jgi:hypothetical protein
MLDGTPARAQEFGGEAVWPRRLASGQVFDRVPYLIDTERCVHVLEAVRWLDEVREVQRVCANHISAKQTIKVQVGSLSHVSMLGEDAVAVS